MSTNKPVLKEEYLQDLCKSWRYEAWINSFPLNRNTVLDYFKHSDFYDRTCNNETLAMQGMDPSHLKNLTGVQYEIGRPDKEREDNTEWLLIRKIYRHSPTKVRIHGLRFVTFLWMQWDFMLHTKTSHSNRTNTLLQVSLINVYFIVGVDPPADNPTAPQRGTVIPLPDMHSVRHEICTPPAHELPHVYPQPDKRKQTTRLFNSTRKRYSRLIWRLRHTSW